MALPLVPIAGIALRYGAVAFAGYMIARNVSRAPRDMRGEEAMDDVNEGLSMRREPDALHGTGRIKRTIRLGETGPGIEIDATSLARIKIKRV